MAEYKATRDGFILGNHFKKGAKVPLTEAQAKYMAAPYGDDVEVVEPANADDKPKGK